MGRYFAFFDSLQVLRAAQKQVQGKLSLIGLVGLICLVVPMMLTDLLSLSSPKRVGGNFRGSPFLIQTQQFVYLACSGCYQLYSASYRPSLH